MNGSWQITQVPGWGALSSPELLAQVDPKQAIQFGSISGFFQGIGFQLATFLPSLLGAIVILILGWLAASIIAAIVRGILNRTNIDNRIANLVMGQRQGAEAPAVEKWASTIIYWVIMTFVLVAFLNALNLQVVSQPLNSFLQQIFAYLPKVGGAAVLLGVAWVLATVSKMLLTTGLRRFRLNERLAEQTGEGSGDSPFLLNETLANALYWFIFLFFLPLILDALDLQGPLAPVQNLLDQILSALPKILTAVIIGAIGWLIARIVRGIVTNLLAASGTDRLGAKFGLTQRPGGLSLSGLIGTIVYVLVLIPTAIAALNALQIQAISAPAVSMLEQILNAIPKIFTAGLILAVFYVIGRFVSELVRNILTSVGFNNIFSWLGLPSTPPRTTTPPVYPSDATSRTTQPLAGEPTVIQETPARTPSEVVGIVTLVGIMLFALVPATEVLSLVALTLIVGGILRISAQVLSGVVVFAVGLYLANLAYSLIASSRGSQSQILANAARIAIITLVGAMALQQMGIAPNIVNLAFGLLFGAIAVAIALAFGLGGREVAATQLREWLADFKSRSQK